MRRRLMLVVTLGVVWPALSFAAAGAVGGIDREQFERDLRALASLPSRALGTQGYERAAQYLRAQIQGLANVQVREHEFTVVAPVTRRAELRVRFGGRSGAEEVHPIYPFWPAQVRVNSTPAEGIGGDLVYLGTATYREIRPRSVLGQVAVVEAGAREAWSQAFYFGARALIVLGSAGMTYRDLESHDLLVPVNLPRFFVPEGELAARLRGASGAVMPRGRLDVQVSWQPRAARNFYALVKPADGAKAHAGSSALMISVPFESSGLVPDLAAGASQAVQAAAGLAMLRAFSREPPGRPVVVYFSGGDSVQFLASRNMFLALSDVPRAWGAELGKLAEGEAALRRDLGRARVVIEDPRTLGPADRGLVERVLRIIETDAALELEELFRLRTRPRGQLSVGEQARVRELEEGQVRFNAVRFAMQREPRQLDPAGVELARVYLAKATGRMERLGGQYGQRRRELEQRVGLYRWLAGGLGRDTDPDGRANDSRLIELLVALDISDGGSRVGPVTWGQFQRTNTIASVQDYRDWLVRQRRAFVEGSGAHWWGVVEPVIDLEPLDQTRAITSWLAASMPIGSEMCPAFGVPGFSMITLDDLRLGRDTPNDTLERLDVSKVWPQVAGVYELLRRAWDDQSFASAVELKWQRDSVRGQVVSQAPGRPVPDLPREGFLATYFYSAEAKVPRLTALPFTLGVRRNEVRETDAEGSYLFEGLPRLEGVPKPGNELHKFVFEVFRVAEDGAITACSDLGRQVGDIKLYVQLTQPDPAPLRSLVFNCEEFSLTGLFDPRYMQDLGGVQMLDARRNAEPQRYNVVIHRQMMAGFVEPGQRSQLIFRYGQVGNRLILVNMAPPPPGRRGAASGVLSSAQEQVREGSWGFSAQQLNGLGNVALQGARDFFRVDDVRIREYGQAGVRSGLVDALHGQARWQIDRAEEAMSQDDGPEMARYANGAWATEARVYQAAQDMANDVVRGAVFLLLLCIPFAFCMERLVVGTPNVYKQIGLAAAIFAGMTAALWAFHPAFKISASPLIVVLSFAIILMSAVVILVLYGRFNTELRRVRSGRATGSTGSGTVASFARASTLSSAVLLGIANMRRRRFRTLLTSVTIVLITFAVLCFAGSTRYLGEISVPTGVTTDGRFGVMLRQRGFRPMPALVAENVRAVLGYGGGPAVAERWWNVNAGDAKEVYHVSAGEGADRRVFAANAVLGLTGAEGALTPAVAEVVPNFGVLAAGGDERIVFVGRSAAGRLGVSEGSKVRIGGLELRVAGVFDEDAFDKRVAALSGEPLTPLRYVAGGLDAGGRKLDENSPEALDVGGGEATTAAEAGGSYEHLSSRQVVIVPKSVSQLLPSASLRSIAVKMAEEREVRRTARELSRRFAAAVFAGTSEGVRMISAGNLSDVRGAGDVAIPLAIAGLIVFNTMMGSIAERRREIHVYASLGLAPLHVGALFIAEALVYGLIGTVFGYVIGQGVGTALAGLGWLGGVTLNYSGTSAIATMGLILLIVLVSALVPARLAAKVAAPSVERTWRVPRPEGDRIVAALPFTINRTAAHGALAYLGEFLEAHREGSIGKFSAGPVEVFADGAARGIRCIVWLTPFDLGIRQDFELAIHPGEFADIYEVQVTLERMSGDPRSWYRMNRAFLGELRKQFLQWRSLTPQRMLEYVEKSRALA